MSQKNRNFKCIKAHVFFFEEGHVFPEIKTLHSGAPLIENKSGTRWVLTPVGAGFWNIITANGMRIADFEEVES